MKSVIKGVGIYLPTQCYSSEEVEDLAGYKKYGIRNGLVKMITGTEKRHYVSEDEHCSDLAYRAALNAMDMAKIEPSSIDAIMFCSVSQDFAEPATANVVADKLDIRNAYAFDIKNGCNAFLTGMDLADSLIKSGKAKNVLIVSGEALSRWVKFDYDDREELLKRSPVTLSIGDGGGAFVVSGENSSDRGLVYSYFRTYSELWNNNVMWGGGVIFPHHPEKMFIPGTTKNLIDKQLLIGADYLKGALTETGWALEDVDCFICSQVAKWISNKTQQELGMDNSSKLIEVIHKWGNVGACNIPLATYEALNTGKIKAGSKVIFYGGAVGFNVGCIAAGF